MTDAIEQRLLTVEPDAPRRRTNPAGEELVNPYAMATVAKVLCRHHNSKLGELFDPVGIAIYDAVQRTLRDQTPYDILLNGHDLEAFVVQRLSAYHFGGILVGPGRPGKDYPIDSMLLEAAFGGSKFRPYCGLVVGPAPAFFPAHGYEVAPLLDPERRLIIGGRVSLGPVALYVTTRVTFPPINGYYRPKVIELISRSGRKQRVILSWDGDACAGPLATWDLRLC